MASHSAFVIANEFLKKDSLLPHMKLQKLVYMCLGWSLAINQESITSSHVEAWDNGPVFPELYRMVRHRALYSADGLLCNETGEPYESQLSVNDKSLIDAVWKRYGHQSALELSDATHQPGTPWTETYLGKGRSNRIDHNLIQAHFTQLGMEGRGN
jgi:uncharacterized phage-associated protein